MARPTVLVATTNPIMALALQERLKEDCRKLGLRLDICPDGEKNKTLGDKDKTLEIGVYQSAEELFDALEKRDPMELADTLVVLDLGSRLTEAFEPKAAIDNGWHVTSHRAGVAVELLLRFPQVFPVFLSPVVPVGEHEVEKNNNIEVVQPAWYGNRGANADKNFVDDKDWAGFYQLRNEVSTKHKPGKPDMDFCKASLYAFQVPLHFVSPLDGGRGLKSTIARFARGMRCWFDPTGLRTLVKNRFLGTVFGNQTDWKAEEQRCELLDRLGNVCVAIDEEREFALLNAYTAWKFGRRAWIVTTYAEYNDRPLWVAGETSKNNDVLVLRDVDIRFPDIPDKKDVRNNLKDINSEEWQDKCGTDWNVRAISGEADVTSEKSVFDGWSKKQTAPDEDAKRKRQGQVGTVNDNLKYFGLRKPISSIYELTKFLGCKAGKAEHSVLARIGFIREPYNILADSQAENNKNDKGHGAPYSNLAMAEALLISSGRCKDHSSAHLIGALLAMESYELLLGMSKTTALEALLALHRHEAAAEVSFPGISHSLNIKDRKKDVEQTLSKLYENEGNKKANDKKPVERMFLSQFWAELRVQYREGEQFDAAEEANVQSLLNMSWKPSWGKRLPGFLLPQSAKSMILQIATSLVWWFVGALSISFMFTFFYAGVSELQLSLLNKEGWITFGQIWSRVVLAMMQMQFNDPKLNDLSIVVNPGSNDGPCFHLLAMLHLGVSYVLFGLLIAMIYRKITRA